MRKPLNQENMKDGDDVRNVYNPDKQPNPWHNYTQTAAPYAQPKYLTPDFNRPSFISSQINPAHPTGLEPPPREYPAQLRQPLIMENPHNENTDFKNWYIPARSSNPTAYTQKTPVYTAKNGVAVDSSQP